MFRAALARGVWGAAAQEKRINRIKNKKKEVPSMEGLIFLNGFKVFTLDTS